jgi:hypothetical protein
VVLRGENVAGGPAHLGAEIRQRLDQHGCLDGHVQAAGDTRALERFLFAELVSQGHQARHFGFGDGDFLAAPVGQLDIGDAVIGGEFIGDSTHLLSPQDE